MQVVISCSLSQIVLHLHSIYAKLKINNGSNRFVTDGYFTTNAPRSSGRESGVKGLCRTNFNDDNEKHQWPYTGPFKCLLKIREILWHIFLYNRAARSWFSAHNPFPVIYEIMSISSGVIGSEQVDSSIL
ncbi:hypothetical protein PR048_009839 [Dryococelus australis]|uniref:Uncharacterized protein n=1 Tax=Dryococelus australis TaxID=614101 RepID=A0ABQ9I1T5_9NEOP|nr:hypothetical protein PR048_009839 [Dryococelus australis]